jgi:dTDP-4-dehydrorhamnose 3,5-epimerase
MIFEPLPLSGAFRVRLEKRGDDRGHFARTFCAREFAARGIDPAIAQCNTSFNRAKGTLRGLHWQVETPTGHAEDKLVRVTRGAVWDVLVDLRPASPSFLQWHGEELTAENGVSLYIPKGFAHGFLTLEENSEVFYQMSEFYDGGSARGARFDDPAFGIEWPFDKAGARPVMSPRDETFPAFDPSAPEPAR